MNSGLKLTDSEIDRLVSQNTSNPTMLRLIADHCETNKLDNKAARIYGMMARSAGSHERKIFDQIAGLIDRATGYDEASAKAWGIEKGNFERVSNEVIESMRELSVKPSYKPGNVQEAN